MIVALGFAAAAVLGAGVRATLTGPEPSAVRAVWVTLMINVAGAFALGLLTGTDIDDPARTIIGVAGLGAFTTFSSAVAQLDELRVDRGRSVTVAFGAVMILAVVSAAALGRVASGL